MLRVPHAPLAATDPRSVERILVSLGEMKVACGRDVVFETEPLFRGFALAAFDPLACIGGMIASAGGEEGAEEADGREVPFRDGFGALSALVESLVRMGADRRRLSFASAGDLSAASGAFAAPQEAGGSGGPRRRLRRLSRPMLLTLDLGRGEAQARAVE